MSEKPAQILVVEDDSALRELLTTVLRKAGYEVAALEDGPAALEWIRGRQPDLILLDVMLPGLDGFEVCRRVRELWHLRTVPVLMLTALGRIEDKLRGIQAGADDYLTKPVAIPELLARVEMHLRRSRRERATNPLSGLPGNPEIEAEIMRRFRSGEPFGIAYVDLNAFKDFNDRYGFREGDRVLQAFARLLQEAMAAYGDPTRDFIGHIGGDDFVLLTRPYVLSPVSREILERFPQAVGASELSVSIVGGVVDPKQGPDLEQLIRHLAALKRQAKRENRPLLLSGNLGLEAEE
jgi:diguanylate cyclase (GGDEF)-like protein